MTDIQCPSPETWLDLYEHRFSVFPLQTHNKRPALDKWEPYQTRRASEAELEQWAGGTIAYNIGIATGAISGIVVLDLDSDDASRIAEGYGIPATVEALTPRGRHIYFRHPGYPCGNIGGSDLPGSKLPKGLDVRGDGGYVVGHGSYYVPNDKERAEGKVEGPYRWREGHSPDDLAFADMPHWLANLFVPPPQAPQQPLQPQNKSPAALIAPAPQTHSLDRLAAYSMAALTDECDKVRSTSSGSRNTQLNTSALKVARHVAAGSLGDTEARDALTAAATECGLERSEIAGTIASAFKAGLADPRHLPSDESDRPSKPIDALGEMTCAANINRCPPAPREYLLDGWIPTGACTGLFGDGGTGKSLVAMMIAAAVSAGKDLWGCTTTKAPTLAFYCEDDADELARRQLAINHGLSLDDGDLLTCYYQSRFSKDSLLGHVDKKSGAFETNELYASIRAKALETGARLVILDNINMVFGDNINDPGVVTRFMAALNGLALEINGAVLLLGHIAKGEGSTFAGTMAWSNASRNRLFLGRPENTAEAARNPDLRHLTRAKSNYARSGDKLDLIWSEGAFVRPEDVSPANALQTNAEVRDDRAFLDLLDEHTRESRPLSASKLAGNYAPRVMAGDNRYRSTDMERRMVQAMARLLRAGTIVEKAPLGWRNESRKEAKGIKRVVSQTDTGGPQQPHQRPAGVQELLDRLAR